MNVAVLRDAAIEHSLHARRMTKYKSDMLKLDSAAHNHFFPVLRDVFHYCHEVLNKLSKSPGAEALRSGYTYLVVGQL
jgi:hypothetical protein